MSGVGSIGGPIGSPIGGFTGFAEGGDTEQAVTASVSAAYDSTAGVTFAVQAIADAAVAVAFAVSRTVAVGLGAVASVVSAVTFAISVAFNAASVPVKAVAKTVTATAINLTARAGRVFLVILETALNVMFQDNPKVVGKRVAELLSVATTFGSKSISLVRTPAIGVARSVAKVVSKFIDVAASAAAAIASGEFVVGVVASINANVSSLNRATAISMSVAIDLTARAGRVFLVAVAALLSVANAVSQGIGQIVVATVRVPIGYLGRFASWFQNETDPFTTQSEDGTSWITKSARRSDDE